MVRFFLLLLVSLCLVGDLGLALARPPDRRSYRPPQRNNAPKVRARPVVQRRVKPRRQPSAFRQKYTLRDLSASLFSATPRARRDKLTHGSYHTRKELRRQVHKARYSDHGRKHLKARTEAEAKSFSTRAAQYLPGLNNAALERTALQKGVHIQRGGNGVWAFYKFDKPVGFDGGEKTHWIRAELASGTFHGHPMKLSRVRKYVSNAD